MTDEEFHYLINLFYTSSTTKGGPPSPAGEGLWEGVKFIADAKTLNEELKEFWED